MRDVYQRANLNVSATAAKDSSVGLFFDRSAREVEPFKVDVAWLTAHNTFALHDFLERVSLAYSYLQRMLLFKMRSHIHNEHPSITRLRPCARLGDF